MKHIFIVNPKSGNGQYKRIIEQINSYFENEDDFEIIMTEYPGHAVEIASRFNDQHRLYAVGGDGTAHEVLNGLNDGVALGLIPAGSGNDFLRIYEPKIDTKTIIDDLIHGDIKKIDYVQFNNKRQLNCANVGLDAFINQAVNKSNIRFVPRKFLYLLYAIKELVSKKTIFIDVIIDGVVETHEVLLATFMNGQYYGGGFRSAPHADVTDGLLDVTLISNVSRLGILRLLPVYFQGKHMHLDIVKSYQVSEVQVSSKHPILVGCDGELEMLKDFKLSVHPQAVKLIVPQGSILKGKQI